MKVLSDYPKLEQVKILRDAAGSISKNIEARLAQKFEERFKRLEAFMSGLESGLQAKIVIDLNKHDKDK